MAFTALSTRFDEHRTTSGSLGPGAYRVRDSGALRGASFALGSSRESVDSTVSRSPGAAYYHQESPEAKPPRPQASFRSAGPRFAASGGTPTPGPDSYDVRGDICQKALPRRDLRRGRARRASAGAPRAKPALAVPAGMGPSLLESEQSLGPQGRSVSEGLGGLRRKGRAQCKGRGHPPERLPEEPEGLWIGLQVADATATQLSRSPQRCRGPTAAFRSATSRSTFSESQHADWEAEASGAGPGPGTYTNLFPAGCFENRPRPRPSDGEVIYQGNTALRFGKSGSGTGSHLGPGRYDASAGPQRAAPLREPPSFGQGHVNPVASVRQDEPGPGTYELAASVVQSDARESRQAAGAFGGYSERFPDLVQSVGPGEYNIEEKPKRSTGPRGCAGFAAPFVGEGQTPNSSRAPEPDPGPGPGDYDTSRGPASHRRAVEGEGFLCGSSTFRGASERLPDVQRRSALPGPGTYEPLPQGRQSLAATMVGASTRLFDQVVAAGQVVPGPGSYEAPEGIRMKESHHKNFVCGGFLAEH